MRLLITGAGGLLGLNLALEALRSHTVYGVDRGSMRTTPFELLRHDLTEAGSFEKALSTSQADAVIHCAAVADVDACEREPDVAWRVNATLPAMIARVCQKGSVRLIHISTDAVFDGTSSAPYSEDDRPNPTSVYARTKLAAEGEVLSAHPHAVVARVNFYGWSALGSRSLAEFFVNNLSAGSRVRGFTDVIFCPMLVNDLGVLLLGMLEHGLNGLFHAVGPQPMSKYDFGVAIAGEFGFDAKLITPDSVEAADLAARRAHNLGLSVHKLSTAMRGPLPAFSTGIRQFHRQYEDGYPQLVRGYQQLSPDPQTGRAGNGLLAGAGPH